MLNIKTLQSIYDCNCEYLTSLKRDELINMCQVLAKNELAILLEDINLKQFSGNYDFSIKEKNGYVVEVCWNWNNRIKVTINPVEVLIDYHRQSGWSRESSFKTAFLYCFK